MAGKLTHFDGEGRVHMVDVGDKPASQRVAIASGHVVMDAATLTRVTDGASKKGDVIAVAELAGIMGAKRTADIIPLCHPVALSNVAVKIHADADLPGLRVEATAKTAGQTGVEMEALVAVSTACLTVYDMLKAVDRAMVIGAMQLEEKSGGASGRWSRT